jgi:hypothetical protein
MFTPEWTPLAFVVIPLVVWSGFWKAVGLWFSARNGERTWFLAILFINLVGILELCYLYSRKCWPFSNRRA